MKPIARTLSAAAFAATAMYWFDPASGRRRRACLADQLQHMTRRIGHGLDAAARDIAHRLRGMTAETKAAFDGAPIDDRIVAERVRSALGRVVSHPGAIEVAVQGGRVELKGPILATEYPALMRAARTVRGVEGVVDRPAVHDSARYISALQGGRPRRAPRFELLQESWSPVTRLLMGAAGLALVIAGVRRPGASAVIRCGIGGSLAARAATNRPFRASG